MTRIVTLGLLIVGSLTTFNGCDYLPEALSGVPDPNAQAIQAAGPSQTSSEGDSAKPVEWNSVSAVADTVVATADAQESIEVSANKVVQTGGTGLTDNFLSTIGGSGTPANTTPPTDSTPTYAMPNSDVSGGLPVPAALTQPGTDGRIVVSAHLRFVNDQEVASPADGLITFLTADEGDVVKKGGLVGQLDDRLPKSEYSVANKEYEAAVEKAKDKSEIEYSKASVEVAAKDLAMTQELEKRGAATQIELDKKWLEARRSELAVTVAEVKNRQDMAAVGVAEAKQGAAEVQIELRKIISPFDGIVADKKKEQHDWVRAGEVIMRLVSLEQLRVTGQVFSAQLKKAPHEMVGAPVVIDIEVFPGKSERVNAKIGYISPVMDTSGGYKLWAQIPNIQSNGQWVFREGMPARIVFDAN